MTFVEARNAIVAGLEAHIGCPVVLSDQIADMPDFPFCYYSVLSTRVTRHNRGLGSLYGGDEFTRTRTEPVDATMSFTFCSQDRESDAGYILGEDEAMDLCEKGHGFFLLTGRVLYLDGGRVVMRQVGGVTSRSGFWVEDAVRRYGFDVRFGYVRTDETPAEVIRSAGTPGETHQ